MDKNRVDGLGHEIKGTIKEVAGKVTGHADTEAEGKAEKVGGKAQGTYGNAKDTLKETFTK